MQWSPLRGIPSSTVPRATPIQSILEIDNCCTTNPNRKKSIDVAMEFPPPPWASKYLVNDRSIGVQYFINHFMLAADTNAVSLLHGTPQAVGIWEKSVDFLQYYRIQQGYPLLLRKISEVGFFLESRTRNHISLQDSLTPAMGIFSGRSFWISTLSGSPTCTVTLTQPDSMLSAPWPGQD